VGESGSGRRGEREKGRQGRQGEWESGRKEKIKRNVEIVILRLKKSNFEDTAYYYLLIIGLELFS
jgi:hypothetical protein